MNKPLAFVIVPLMAYLCGAFMAASFNIVEWLGELRALCVLLGIPIAGIVWAESK